MVNVEEFSASSTNLSASLSGIGAKKGAETPPVGSDENGQTDATNSGKGVALPNIKTVLGAITAAAPQALGASGDQKGTSSSAIADGAILITSGDAASQEVADSISRDTANGGALIQEFDEARRAEIQEGFAVTKELIAQTSIFFANRAAEADRKEEESKKKEEEAQLLTTIATNLDIDLTKEERDNLLKRAIDLSTEAKTLEDASNAINKRFGPASTSRQIITAITAAASGNAAGGSASLVKDFAAHILQQRGAELVGDLSKKGDINDTQAIALHALVGCAGGGASTSGNCTAGAAGQGGAKVLGILLGLGDDKDASEDEKLSAEEREAQSKLLQAIVGIIGTSIGAEGSDLASAIAGAQAEVDNNQVVEDNGQKRQVTLADLNDPNRPKLSDLKNPNSDKYDPERYQSFIDTYGSEEKANAVIKASNDLAALKFSNDPTKVAEHQQLVDLYGSEEAATLATGLINYYQENQTELAADLLNAAFFSRVDSTVQNAAFIAGTTVSLGEGVVESAEGIVTVLSDIPGSARKAKEIVNYIRENPDDFLAGLSDDGIAFLREAQSQAVLLGIARIQGDTTGTASHSYALGRQVGPLVLGVVTGGAGLLAASSKAGKIISTIAKTGKRPDAPDIDTPNSGRSDSNGPDSTRDGDTSNDNNAGNTNTDEIDGNTDRTPENSNTNPNNPPPPIRTERIDADNVQRGTREYDILNNPPPNTRIELSNGNVYITNADGFVDEVSFQPRLVKGKRDARQTAVGKEGLDTDVGGHIQGCAIGGTCDRVNLFPQDANFNNSSYKKFENDIRRALEAKEDVGPVKVKFTRKDPKNPRPDTVEVEYTINGVIKVRPFENKHGG